MPRPVWLLPLRRDVLLALGVLALSQVEVWWYGAAGGSRSAALALGGAALALAWRGRQPIVTAVLVELALTLCAVLAAEPFSATSVVSVTITFFSVGAMPRRLPATLTLAAFILFGVTRSSH